jgi:hypothetical protein
MGFMPLRESDSGVGDKELHRSRSLSEDEVISVMRLRRISNMLYRTTSTLIGLAALSLLACDNDKSKTEPAPTTMTPPASSAVGQNTVTGAAMNAPAPAETAVAPSNAADVKRFDDEMKMSTRTNEKLTTNTMNVRKSPGGELITTLPKDTEVTQLSRRQDYYLIEFANPTDSTKREMGWIYKDAFYKGDTAAAGATAAAGSKMDTTVTGKTATPDKGATAAKAAPPLACTAPNVRAATDTEFCAKPCKMDDDCKPVGTCDGEGMVYSGGQKVARGKYCVTGGSIGAAIGAAPGTSPATTPKAK